MSIDKCEGNEGKIIKWFIDGKEIIPPNPGEIICCEHTFTGVINRHEENCQCNQCQVINFINNPTDR